MRKLDILIVDDDAMMTRTLKDIFSVKGYNADTANSGKEALKKFKKRTYDCLISDIKMPDINGVELYRRIKKIGVDLPVILMTAYCEDELVKEGLEEKVITILSKPLRMETLFKFFSTLQAKGNIIIADDDPVFSDAMSRILERHGFNFINITDPYKLVESINKDIDIVLLDMAFDEVSGLSLYKEIKEIYPSLPVIFVTGHGEEYKSHIKEALHLGAQKCFYKPFPKKKLISYLNRFFYDRLSVFFEEEEKSDPEHKED